MARFWISWVQCTEDYRPLTFPPNAAILGWWCSGFDSSDSATICAAVEATDADAACDAIFKDWPEAEAEFKTGNLRFIETVDGNWRPSDRFPLSEWMVPRFAKP